MLLATVVLHGLLFSVPAASAACSGSQELTCLVQDAESRRHTSLIQRVSSHFQKSSHMVSLMRHLDANEPTDDLDEELQGLEKELESGATVTEAEPDTEPIDQDDLEKQLEEELNNMETQEQAINEASKSQGSQAPSDSKGVLAWMSDALGGKASSNETQAGKKDTSAKVRKALRKEAAKKAAKNNHTEKQKAKQATNSSDQTANEAPLQSAGVGQSAMGQKMDQSMKDEFARTVSEIRKEVTEKVAKEASEKVEKELAKVREQSKDSQNKSNKETKKSSDQEDANASEHNSSTTGDKEDANASTQNSSATSDNEDATLSKQNSSATGEKVNETAAAQKAADEALPKLAKELAKQIEQDRKEVAKEVVKEVKKALPKKKQSNKGSSEYVPGETGFVPHASVSKAVGEAAQSQKVKSKDSHEHLQSKHVKSKDSHEHLQPKKTQQVESPTPDASSNQEEEPHGHMVTQEMGMQTMGGSVEELEESSNLSHKAMTVEEALKFEDEQRKKKKLQKKLEMERIHEGTYADRLNKNKLEKKRNALLKKEKGLRKLKEAMKKKRRDVKAKTRGQKGKSYQESLHDIAKHLSYEDILAKKKMDMNSGTTKKKEKHNEETKSDAKARAAKKLKKSKASKGKHDSGKSSKKKGGNHKHDAKKAKSKGKGSSEPPPPPPPDIPLSPGQNVTLDETGYRIVVEKVSDAEMELFIRRVIEQLGLVVRDEGKFKGMVPFYSGKAANQTFNALVGEINQATARRCGWVSRGTDADVSGSTAPLSEKGYSQVAQLHSGAEMKKLAERVIKGMNYKVLDSAGLVKIVPAHSCEAETQTLEALKAEIKAAARQPGKSWVGWKQKDQQEVN